MGVMRGSRKFCQRGSKYDIFYYDKGREDPSTTICGRFGGVPMMALF